MAGLSQELVCQWAVNCQKEVHAELPRMGRLNVVFSNGNSVKTRVARFGSVTLRFGDGTVRVVPVFGSGGSSKEGFLCVSVQFNREDGSGSGFASWKTVLAVPVPCSVPGKTVLTVPVSGSGFRFLDHPEKLTLTPLLILYNSNMENRRAKQPKMKGS